MVQTVQQFTRRDYGARCAFDAHRRRFKRIAMNSMYEVEDRHDGFAADASLDQRVAFIRRVYGHMLGATLLFVACAALFVNTPAIYEPLFNMLTLNKWGPLALIGAFMVASWVAQ